MVRPASAASAVRCVRFVAAASSAVEAYRSTTAQVASSAGDVASAARAVSSSSAAEISSGGGVSSEEENVLAQHRSSAASQRAAAGGGEEGGGTDSFSVRRNRAGGPSESRGVVGPAVKASSMIQGDDEGQQQPKTIGQDYDGHDDRVGVFIGCTVFRFYPLNIRSSRMSIPAQEGPVF